MGDEEASAFQQPSSLISINLSKIGLKAAKLTFFSVDEPLCRYDLWVIDRSRRLKYARKTGSEHLKLPEGLGVDVAAMAGSLVHEIKNPLSTINLSAQLLQEEWKDASTPKEQRALRRLEVMSSEVQRVERIIETFLRFTERHKLALEVKSLNEMLEDLAEFMTANAERSGVQLRLGLSCLLYTSPSPRDS